MTLTTQAQLTAALPGRLLAYYRNFVSGSSPTYMNSFWQPSLLSGGGITPPPASASPPTGSGEVPTSATLGALPFINAAAGKQLYLGAMQWFNFGNDGGFLMLYDRLVHTSGLAFNITTPQTINSVSVPTAGSARNPDGLGGLPYMECYSAPFGSGGPCTISYTNSDGVSGQTGVSPTWTASGSNSRQATTMMPIDLQAGDKGIRSVETATMGTAEGSAGNGGITIVRPIYIFPVSDALIPQTQDWLDMALTPIPASACLAMATCPLPSSSSGFRGSYSFIEG